MRVSQLLGNKWCFFLVLLLPFKLCNTAGDANNEFPEGGHRRIRRFVRGPLIDEDYDDLGEEPRKAARYLCSEPGCTCNSNDRNLATEVNCKCMNKNAGNFQTIIKVSRYIILPPKLHTFRILNCDNVELEKLNTEISTFQSNLTEVLIQNSTHVHISANVLKNVANLIVKDVALFSFNDQAFSSLESNTVHFSNVTFNNDSTSVGLFNPRIIKSRLEFLDSKLPNIMAVQINQQDVTGLTTSFHNCHFYEGLSEDNNIRASHVEIIANQFSKRKLKDARPVSVEFYQSLNVSGNLFANFRMPSVRYNLQKMNAAGEMEISFPNQKTNTEDSATADAAVEWLKSLNFVFKNVIANKANVNGNLCQEKWSLATPLKYLVQCPNLESMNLLVNSPRFKTFFINRSEHKTGSSASVTSFSIYSLLSALFILSFSMN